MRSSSSGQAPVKGEINRELRHRIRDLSQSDAARFHRAAASAAALTRRDDAHRGQDTRSRPCWMVRWRFRRRPRSPIAPGSISCVCPACAGMDQAMEDRETIEFVRRESTRVKYVTSVCTGAFILGAAGLLQGKRATTHWAFHHLLPRVGAIPVKERVVRDGNTITGGGVTSGIDFAFTVMRMKSLGPPSRRRAALFPEYDPKPTFEGRLAGPRPGGDQGHRRPALRAAPAGVREGARSRRSMAPSDGLNDGAAGSCACR